MKKVMSVKKISRIVLAPIKIKLITTFEKEKKRDTGMISVDCNSYRII